MRSWLRFSLRWLIAAMAFLAVLVSHIKTSLDLRQARREIASQQAELKQLRDELGVFEVTDPAKAHAIFVRRTEDKAWRWRVYLPPGRRYMMKWAVDDIPGRGELASQWEGQHFEPLPLERSTFNVDLYLRKGADGKWRWFVRYPWGELSRELPETHSVVAPQEPVALNTDIAGRMEVTVSDLREPLVLFRYQVIPQAEFDAAQTQGKMPEGPHDGVQVWIELAK
jgi:hypothetical protein